MHQISMKTRMWVEYQLDGVILSNKPLHGGMSSQLNLLEIESRNGKQWVVLREYTNKDWLESEPDIALQEAKNLDQARKLSITTPVLIAFDHKAENTTYPSLIMSQVEGSVLLKSVPEHKWIEQLAQTLVKIHQFKEADVSHKYFRYFDPKKSVTAGWSTVPEKWIQAFEYLNKSKQPEYLPSFIHRDFHPTNVLFHNNLVSGVVDWTNACIGPKQIDIAHCRWNLAMIYGQETADLFLEAYQKESPAIKYDAYWDLEALGNVFTEERPSVYGGWTAFGLHHLTEETMIERMDQFLLKALQNL